jgi:hypothetical protein
MTPEQPQRIEMNAEEFVKKWCEMFDLKSVVELDDFMQRREHIHMLPLVLKETDVTQFVTVGVWLFPNEKIMVIDDLPVAWIRDGEIVFENPESKEWRTLYEVN